ncbi:pre-peptidase C-terminal domain-containing protein, partial [Lachnoclostridium sp.]|uniref:pre-peptidase C-terminal domain-containing protein n=1 Tax=Lachnoclostridium sp. TaxID=2028282 RepID=UPI00289D607E
LLIILSLMLIIPSGKVYAEESVINAYTTSKEDAVVNTITFPEEENTYSEELKLSRGALIINVADTQDTKYSMVTLTIFSDVQKKTKVGSVTRFYGDKETQKTIEIPKDGTYTVTYELSRRNEPQEISFHVTYSEVLNKDQTLKKGETVVGYLSSDLKETLYKITIEETGYISVKMETDSPYGSIAYMSILDSKKKELEKEEYVNVQRKDTMYYGVKKGTYYIKVRSSVGIYSISYSFQKVKDNGAAKKADATALSLGGKAKSGVILADSKDTTAEWFKFTLKESTKIAINVSGNTNNTMRFEMESDSVNFIFNNLKITNNTKERTGTFTNALPKGTYYIKVYKGTSGSSGNYSVQVTKEK